MLGIYDEYFYQFFLIMYTFAEYYIMNMYINVWNISDRKAIYNWRQATFIRKVIIYQPKSRRHSYDREYGA